MSEETVSVSRQKLEELLRLFEDLKQTLRGETDE